MTEAALLHEREGGGPRRAGRRRGRAAVHQVGDAIVERDAAKEPAADVAVGDDTDQARVVVDDHHRLAAVLGDRLERLANGSGRWDEERTV